MEEAFPLLELRTSPPAPGPEGARPPQAVLIARSADPGLVLTLLDAWNGSASPPAVIILGEPGGPWPEELVQRLGQALVLEKSAGVAFLDELVNSVRPRPEVVETPSPPEEAGRFPKAPSEPAGERRPPLSPFAGVIGELVEALHTQVGSASRLVQFLRYRMGQDPVARCYLRSLEDELARAAAVGRRLSGVLGEPSMPRGRLCMNGATLVGLRAAAWRLWLSGKAEVSLFQEGKTPRLEVDGMVLGGALDDLVLEIGEAPGVRGVEVRVGPGWLDEEFCRTHPGSRPGLFTRIGVRAGGGEAAPGTSLEGETRPGTVLLQRGLAASKAHGGYLEWAWDRETGRLSALTLYLPSSPPRPESAREASLLIVDDDPGVRGVAEEILRSAGWEATSVASAERALELFQAGRRFDLILLDMHLEGMGGEDAFPRLLSLDPRARVVICSGSQVPRALRRLFGEGALGFIPKPFGRRDLVELLGGMLP